MHELKRLRSDLGLSQIQLANYLEIPLATLAMAELDQRQLPTKSALKLSQLQLAIVQSANKPFVPPVSTSTKWKKQLQLYSSASILQYMRLEKKLLKMQEAFTAAENLLKLLALLEKNLPEIDDGKTIDRPWIAYLQRVAQEKYISNGTAAQKLIAVKIAVLQLAEKLAKEGLEGI